MCLCRVACWAPDTSFIGSVGASKISISIILSFSTTLWIMKAKIPKWKLYDDVCVPCLCSSDTSSRRCVRHMSVADTTLIGDYIQFYHFLNYYHIDVSVSDTTPIDNSHFCHSLNYYRCRRVSVVSSTRVCVNASSV